MIIFILVIIVSSIHANELFSALLKNCQLNSSQARSIFFKFSFFSKNLEHTFFKTSSRSLKFQEYLRELDAPYIWSLLQSFEPSLALNLMALRNKIIVFKKEQGLDDKCLNWMDNLLGDRENTFIGSYVELVIKALSATWNTKLAEMSTKQMLFAHSQIRKSFLEREHLFVPRIEEIDELYEHSMFSYRSLINCIVGDAIKDNLKRTTFFLRYVPASQIYSKPCNSITHSINFPEKYLDVEKDFIYYGKSMHLRKTKNFSSAYRNWMNMMMLIPDEATRKMYYEEQKDLTVNLKKLETRIHRLHVQKDNHMAVLSWDEREILNLTIAFDLIGSLIAYEQIKTDLAKVRQMFIEVKDSYHILRDFLG